MGAAIEILEPRRTERLEAYLGELGLISGPATLEALGDGHSNLTYLLRSGERCLVLRRPPHGPIAPSANNVVREARLLEALHAIGHPVPSTLAICEDAELIGAPFYVMTYVAGEVLTDALPGDFGSVDPRAIADELVDALVELHASDPEDPRLDGFGRRSSDYLDRQLRRFGGLLAHNATRTLPGLERTGRWLEENLPGSTDLAIVHGDYRLGNVMFGPPRSGVPKIAAILDWELATIGDPLADIGYCTAMWASPEDGPNPMLELSQVTREPGFPPRDYLAQRYGERTGRDLADLRWYQALAVWKSAIFLEGSYGRYLAGASTDPYFASLDTGVEQLSDLAIRLTQTT